MPNIPPIPPLFLDRMQRFLGEGYAKFIKSLDETPVSGLRVNTLKITTEEFEKISPFTANGDVPWCPAAFTLAPNSLTPNPSPIERGELNSPGKHPYHLAGLYYLQDPSAMSPAELLFSIPMQDGERVLDLSAAPGGKTTHLAALMGGRGLLVANEIKDKRVGHLAQNVERWGASNVVITNETPERLADHFGAFFDRVLVDAPCSGEGMFRKDMGARIDWSPEMVAGCAVRQSNILRLAAKLVKPGGYLLYSTCTFAPEEDEAVISRLLDEFSDFKVLDLPRYPGFLGGQPDWLDEKTKNKHQHLEGAVRLFPHMVDGEGHFACLLQRIESDKRSFQRTFEAEKRIFERIEIDKRIVFWREFEGGRINAGLAEDRLRVAGERLYYLPDEMPNFGRLRVVHPGVWLGVLKKDRFEPAHPLALFLNRGEAVNVFDLDVDDPRLAAYLRGETIATDATGWTVVTVDGFPLGWGKGVQGVLKNHYPRGWMA